MDHTQRRSTPPTISKMTGALKWILGYVVIDRGIAERYG
jgi:hypothetical protein